MTGWYDELVSFLHALTDTTGLPTTGSLQACLKSLKLIPSTILRKAMPPLRIVYRVVSTVSANVRALVRNLNEALLNPK